MRARACVRVRVHARAGDMKALGERTCSLYCPRYIKAIMASRL